MSIHRPLAGLLALCLLAAVPAAGQNPPPTPPQDQIGSMMLTIFLRHNQSETLDEINARLAQQHFYETFPPRGIEIVSWYVMMGVGQVVTLRFPAERLREVNRAIERTAWGPYQTEFYPTYDYKPTALDERRGR